MEQQRTDTIAGGQNDLLILSALDLLQGILLLHPPSRSLFGREIYMNVSHPVRSSRRLHHRIPSDTRSNRPPHTCLTALLISSTAPPRPPRPLHKPPRNPIRRPANPRDLPTLPPQQHAHLRSHRRPAHRNIALQIAQHIPVCEAQGAGIPVLLPDA